MSSPKHDRDSDRESLTGWTLVDREGKEGNPEKTIRRRGKKEDVEKMELVREKERIWEPENEVYNKKRFHKSKFDEIVATLQELFPSMQGIVGGLKLFPDDKDSGESSSSPVEVDVKKKEEENKEKNESGCGTEEEEGEEELSEDLISMGKRVQEIKGESVKASSGSDSSDIETLDCPGPDDFYEDHTQGYSSLHSSLLSSSLSGFTFVEDAGEIATYAL
ncbi:hypothetical protein E2C01_020183 [Portunus trituberculatus]|uniref:Uncharacterized protein n=1 Tax=Portunus trituberculatus TaxID=210409 RepID=A0A5B7DZ52_PORTR|nr:hypothetical protein [Portunus trituberculatus]